MGNLVKLKINGEKIDDKIHFGNFGRMREVTYKFCIFECLFAVQLWGNLTSSKNK